MTTTLCVSGSVVDKAGENVNSTAAADDALLTDFINHAEGVICAAARYDFVTASGSTTTIGANFLEGVCSDLAAIYLIEYDPSGFTNQREAETKMDVLTDKSGRALSLLKDQKVVKFLHT